MKKLMCFFMVCACLYLASEEGQNPYIILSVDGGGIRGVIPAHIISLFEKYWGLQSAEVFDAFAGTSTGGIIAIALTTPDLKYMNKPRYWASDIENLYVKNGAQIFDDSWLHWITTLDGLIAPKYNATNLQKLLTQMLGTTTLEEVIKDLFVISFDITTYQPFLFENIDHKTLHNSHLVNVALSTSAAPYYFPSHQDLQQNLVDGGVVADNPALWAYFEALKHSPQVLDKDVYIFSIGTGTFPQAPDTTTHAGLLQDINPIINELFDGSVDIVGEAFSALSAKNKVHYIRWQPSLTKSSQQALDNTAPENIQELLEIAEDYFNKQVSSEKFAPLKALLDARVKEANTPSPKHGGV